MTAITVEGKRKIRKKKKRIDSWATQYLNSLPIKHVLLVSRMQASEKEESIVTLTHEFLTEDQWN